LWCDNKLINICAATKNKLIICARTLINYFAPSMCTVKQEGVTLLIATIYSVYVPSLSMIADLLIAVCCLLMFFC
jgi:hypothetical protein